MNYFIIDVFCKEKYSGNQLAVVFASENLSETEMQKIANEFHYSETTFVFPKAKHESSYRARIFTPKNEVPFAGHPTLGTAWLIKNELEENTSEILLNLNIGQIPVQFNDFNDIQFMKQIEPVFGSEHTSENVAAILNIQETDIDKRYPVQSVSTGIEFLIVPLTSLAAIKSASTNLTEYKKYFKNSNELPVFIFSPETYEPDNQYNCRMFADTFGVPEDAATGSANGCFAAYLSKYRIDGKESIDVKVE